MSVRLMAKIMALRRKIAMGDLGEDVCVRGEASGRQICGPRNLLELARLEREYYYGRWA